MRKTLLYLFLIVTSFFSLAGSKVKPPIQKALDSSVLVAILDTKVGQTGKIESWPIRIGSGFAIKANPITKTTLVATNDHVCQGSRGTDDKDNIQLKNKLNTQRIEVRTSNGKSLQGVVVLTTNVNYNSESLIGNDLCLIEVYGLLPTVALNDEGAVLGEEVFAVGAPQGWFPIVSRGYTSSTFIDDKGNLIQVFSLPIDRGSSGGAIFNNDGKVVGVVFAKDAEADDASIVIAFGVPVSYLKRLLHEYEKSK
jgi:S1-C subfamily serine protease